MCSISSLIAAISQWFFDFLPDKAAALNPAAWPVARGVGRGSCENAKGDLLQKSACHTCIGDQRGEPLSSQRSENCVCLLEATCNADDLRNSTKLFRIYGQTDLI